MIRNETMNFCVSQVQVLIFIFSSFYAQCNVQTERSLMFE